MKKFWLATLLCFALSGAARAQETPAFVTSTLFERESDFAWILDAYNVHAYQVDLLPLKGGKYLLKYYIDEYHGRDSVKNLLVRGTETARSFPEKDIYYEAERVRMLFRPEADSTAFLAFSIPKFFNMQMPLRLKPLNGRYMYNSRPFARTEFEVGKKIPVALYGSVWYDEKYKITRFCGMNELPVDMDDEIFDLIPHYFIVSLQVEEMKK